MRRWTEEEVKRARDLRSDGRAYGEIDKALRRRAGSTISGDEVGSKYSPASLLAERDTLAAAREQRTLTRGFLWRSPPGYSALNGKTGPAMTRRRHLPRAIPSATAPAGSPSSSK
jgi:hypothetical protein